MDPLKTDNNSLRKFGFTMAGAFLIIGALVFLKKHYLPWQLYYPASFFFITGLIFPWILKGIYIIWMKFAFILGWINTRVILVLLFYFIISPIGIILRLCGKDFLEEKIKKTENSYWKKKENIDDSLAKYERQF